ncbi:hypothetical protein [Epilithonimonas hominis]|uniref:Uncharacterized protein n=1 Tax=Epilithonimonas hominis TaxID=420404 RepID=A0A1H6J0C5_9FLAO|nr:hypothetical protein [Epilithonimonas hominis]SEH53546.1 hypothetical protein SAMN05421793_11032 [Epilithonimonas hominis]
MKNYYFTLLQQIIGIFYLLIFIIGYFTKTDVLVSLGGFGMLIFMTVMTMYEPSKLFKFLGFVISLGIIGYFFITIKKGIFVASAIFTFGQIFGLIHYLGQRNQIAKIMEENNISDKIGIREISGFVILIVVPYLISIFEK